MEKLILGDSTGLIKLGDVLRILASGTAWLSYNDPAFLARRHGVGAENTTTNALAAALEAIASKANGCLRARRPTGE